MSIPDTDKTQFLHAATDYYILNNYDSQDLVTVIFSRSKLAYRYYYEMIDIQTFQQKSTCSIEHDSCNGHFFLVYDNTRRSHLVFSILTTQIGKVSCEKEVAKLS